MTPREWTTVDKAAWGPGPWQSEPDKIHWIDPATDLDCLMVRNRHGGYWCGYVAVTEGHPWFGVAYMDCPIGDDHYCDHAPTIATDVHGGLTYSDFCMETEDESVGVCHVPQPGRPDRVWWFGFDCAHLYDRRPGGEAREREKYGWEPLEPTAQYRDRRYVEAEVVALARQLAAVPT